MTSTRRPRPDYRQIAVDQLARLGAREPSQAAIVSMVRTLILVGRGSLLGLHQIPGVVVVDVHDGAAAGWAPGDCVVDVRAHHDHVDDVLAAAQQGREVAERLEGGALRVVVRVRAAGWWDRVRARVRVAAHLRSHAQAGNKRS